MELVTYTTSISVLFMKYTVTLDTVIKSNTLSQE